MDQSLGKFLVVLGAVIIGVGLFVYFGGHRWLQLGRLPGDIRVEGEHTKFFFPITTSIVLSILLTAILYIVSRLR